MRKELLELTGALKGHIVAVRESGRGISGLYLKGDLRALSLPPIDSVPDNKATHVRSKTLDDIRAELSDCTRCKLYSGRRHIVFGEGDPHADLVFVGEAPGGDEDRQGRPFVGRAGKLLSDIITAMGFTREQVYICNILKCRPPQNRNPEPDEIAACEPFLVKQLRAIRPRMICALGKFAAQTLLKTDTPISVLRGRFHSYHDIRLMPTYHPAYLLRNPGAKKQTWEDVQMIMKELR